MAGKDLDIKLPKGVTLEVAPGTTRKVLVGSSLVPAEFGMAVKWGAGSSGEWKAVLTFAADPDAGEVVLKCVQSSHKDVDEVIDHLRKHRPITWWKRRAVVEWVLNDASLSFEVPSLDLAWEDHTEAQRAAITQGLIRAESAIMSAASVPVTRRRDRVTLKLLQEVAAVYKEAWAGGHNPTVAVGKHFHKSHSTAARWVGLARKHDGVDLGPADGSRGGERAPAADSATGSS